MGNPVRTIRVKEAYIMKSTVLIIFAFSCCFVLAGVVSGHAQQSDIYLPSVGDDVVIYLQKYKHEDYEKAKRIQTEALGGAMKDSGQTRRTYFAADPHSYETVAVSFFKKGHKVDDWHTHEARLSALKKLEPLFREPITVHRYEVSQVHETKPYLPQVGDEVVIYTQRWKAEHFETANRMHMEGIGEAIESSGQMRRTYWVVDRNSHETIVISFFKKGHNVDDWHTFEDRRAVLNKLEPLRREQQIVRQYQVLLVHDTK